MTEEFDAFESLEDLFRAAEAPEGAPLRPFKFLDPYGPGDRQIFFGREQDIAVLYARFYKSRLLVVYGESGAGKTSLVQCGLRGEIPSTDAAFFTIRSAQDPLEALRGELQRYIGLPPDETQDTLVELLRQAERRKSKPLVLVFDQFEEFFIFQPPTIREQFIQALNEWLSLDLSLRVIICLREDFLARLSELEEVLPEIFWNKFWVRRLSREQAREAIYGPCRQCGVSLEPSLGEELLNELTRGGQGVDLPILQVVLDKLYQQALAAAPASPTLTLAAYQELGRIDSILARFLEDTVAAYDNPEEARQVLKAMTIREGSRRVSSLAEIAEQTGNFGEALTKSEVKTILDRLLDDRIVRVDPDRQRFELRHDALAPTVNSWLRALEKEVRDACEILESRFKEYDSPRRTLLDAGTLAYLAPFERWLPRRKELVEFIDRSKRAVARTRRRRRLLAGTALGLFVLVVSSLGIYSYVLYREAQASAQRAVAALDLALSSSNRVIFYIHDKLQDSPDLHELRRNLLVEAMVGLNTLASQIQGGDPRIDHNLWGAYYKLGDNMMILGWTGAAREMYEESLKMAERLARQDPTSVQAQSDLFISYEKLGEVSLREDNLKEARDFFKRCLEITEPRAKKNPDNAQAQRDLFILYEKLGEVSLREDNLKEARDFFKRCLEITEPRTKKNPDDAQAQSDLFISYEKLGEVSLREDNLKEARDFFKRCLEITEPRAKKNPDNAQAQRDLFISYSWLGELSLREDNLKEARDFFKRCLEITEPRAKKNPDDAQAQRDLVLSYAQLGKASLKEGKIKDARTFWLKALQRLEAMIQTSPDRVQLHIDRGECYLQLGLISKKAGRADEAATWLRKAQEQLRPLGVRRQVPTDRSIKLYLLEKELAEKSYHPGELDIGEDD